MADFGKLNFAVSFNPQTAFPLDARYYFSTLSAAQAAAAAADKQGKGESQVGHGDDAVDDDAGRDGLGSLIHGGYPHFSLF